MKNYLKQSIIPVFLFIALMSHAAESTYYKSLEKEFEGVGKASFIGGSTESDVMKNLNGQGDIQLVKGQAFSESKRLIVKKKPSKFWDAKRSIYNDKPVKKGESLLVLFWAKGKKAPQFVDDGAGAEVQPYIHSYVGKFHKGRVTSFYDVKPITEKWQRFFIKTGPLPMDFPKGKLALVFMMGQKAQTIDVGGIAWMLFPEGADVDEMPKKSLGYVGRSPNAPWRKEAARRIKKYRKGDMKIQVVDGAGKPVAGAKVKVEMKAHDFIFGTATNVWAFSKRIGGMTDEDLKTYKEISVKYFNSVTIENALKWHLYEPGRYTRLKDIVECMEYYKANDVKIRGHVLVWPSYFRLPKSLKAKLKADKKALKLAVENHITEEVLLFKQWVTDWDVTNETAINRAMMDALGPQVIVEWYKLARKLDPNVSLTFNEPKFGSAGMEIGSFPERLLSDKCRGWVDYMIQNGAPLDSLGAQVHGGCVSRDYKGKTGAEGLWAYYDDFYARYKKRMQYTELDIKIADESDPEQLSYQADKLRDSIIIAFAHPAFDGVSQWGFWAGRHWAPTAALWTKDWKLRPNGKAYIDLVFKRWWTNAELTTDANGFCQVNGFFGKYDITVKDRKDAKTTYSFKKKNKNSVLTIKAK